VSQRSGSSVLGNKPKASPIPLSSALKGRLEVDGRMVGWKAREERQDSEGTIYF